MQESRLEHPVRIKLKEVSLEGVMGVCDSGKGVVIFAHGSGSSRLSPRNTFVARVLQEAGFCTLLFDLLTPAEDRVYENRFNIGLLTERLMGATRWLLARQEGEGRAIGYFGASTGAAAGLQAAAEMGNIIRAVVSRGGRPDMAAPYLEKVLAPTLLIVGELDMHVLGLNRQALAQLTAEKKLAIVPGATHLFEEPGTLEQAAALAQDWFLQYLGQGDGRSAHGDKQGGELL